nr:MAG TPA: hypothetical protein [Caudoviricetes sp.]
MTLEQRVEALEKQMVAMEVNFVGAQNPVYQLNVGVERVDNEKGIREIIKSDGSIALRVGSLADCPDDKEAAKIEAAVFKIENGEVYIRPAQFNPSEQE